MIGAALGFPALGRAREKAEKTLGCIVSRSRRAVALSEGGYDA